MNGIKEQDCPRHTCSSVFMYRNRIFFNLTNVFLRVDPLQMKDEILTQFVIAGQQFITQEMVDHALEKYTYQNHSIIPTYHSAPLNRTPWPKG